MGRTKLRNYWNGRYSVKEISLCGSVPAYWSIFTKTHCENNQFGGCVFGFECYRVEAHVCVDTAPAIQYGTIDSSLYSRHRKLFLREQPAVYPEEGEFPSPPIIAKMEHPRWSSWYALYANHVGLALWWPGYSVAEYVHYPGMVSAVIKGAPLA